MKKKKDKQHIIFYFCSCFFSVRVINSIEAGKESNFGFFYALFANPSVRCILLFPFFIHLVCTKPTMLIKIRGSDVLYSSQKISWRQLLLQ